MKKVLLAAASVLALMAQSPDGSTIVPNPNLVTKDGTWTFGQSFPGFAGFWHINLNGRSTGAGGHRMTVADGGKMFVQSMSGWFVYDSSTREFVRSDAPPAGGGGPPVPDAVVFKVGPNQTYRTVSAAVQAANADTSGRELVVEIANGTYTNDFMEVHRAMMLRSAGGPVTLRATQAPPNGKAIVIAWAPLIVDGLTFQGAHLASAGNGAGIRDHNYPGGSLTVSNSLFTQNDVGILTDPRATIEAVTITDSKFINNGYRSQHALYVNAGTLTVTGSLFCGQLVGHLIKSRASDNEITNNQIYDGAAVPALGCNQGTSSLAIDISNGGRAVISGNKITQGPGSPQYKMLSYGGEGLTYRDNVLVITQNSFASPGTPYSTAIYDPTCARARPGSRIADNTFESIRTQIDPATCVVRP